MADNNLEYTLKLNKGNFEGGMKSAEEATKRLDDGFSKLKETILTIVGVTAGVEFFKGAIEKFVEADKIATQLKFTLSKRGGLAGSFAELQEQSEKLAGNSMFSNGEIEKAQSSLLNYGISVKSVKDHMQGIADIAGIKGEGIEEVAMKIARASKMGTMRGIAEYGINTKKLSEDFKAGASQAYIFDEAMGMLDKRFTGAGAELMNTYAGKIHKLQVEWEHVQEVIGGKVIPKILELINYIKENKETIEALVIGIGGVITALKVWQTLAIISAAINPWTVAITAAGTLLALLVKIKLENDKIKEQKKSELFSSEEEIMKSRFDAELKHQLEINHLKKATRKEEEAAFKIVSDQAGSEQDKMNTELRALKEKYIKLKHPLDINSDGGQQDWGRFKQLTDEINANAAAVEKIAPKIYKGNPGENGEPAPPAKEENHNEHIVINITKMVETLEIHPSTLQASAAQIRDQVGALFQQVIAGAQMVKTG